MSIQAIGKGVVMSALADKANRLRATGTGVNILEEAVFESGVVDPPKQRVLYLDGAVQFDVNGGAAGRNITKLTLESSIAPAGVVYEIDVSAEEYDFEEVGGRLTITELEIFIDE